MHPAHTADTRADVIFIDNGAPEVLVGCCYENRMAGCGLMHLAHTAETRADVIFIDNGAQEVLVGCYENRMAGCGLMHLAHTADTRADVIFIDNGAPEVLVGSQGGNRGEDGGRLASATMGIWGSRTAGERGVGGWRRSVFSAEAATADVLQGDDARERGVGVGRRRIGELARTSRSCSSARLEAEAIDGARRATLQHLLSCDTRWRWLS